MKLADYKKALKGHEAFICNAATAAFTADWRIGAVGALNKALQKLHLPGVELCTHEGTANSVLEYCERKTTK